MLRVMSPRRFFNWRGGPARRRTGCPGSVQSTVGAESRGMGARALRNGRPARSRIGVVAVLVGTSMMALTGPVVHGAAAGNRAAGAACPTASSVAAGANPAALEPADNDFGFRLLAAVQAENSGKNVFLSPTSAAIMLDMLYGGSRGTSQAELASLLGLKRLGQQAVLSRASALLAGLRSADPKVRLEVADSVWSRAGVQFRKAFLDQAKRSFGAKVSALDFSSPSAPATINRWVACATHNRITRMVSSIPAAMVMYVMNATYFHGLWTTSFDPRNTQNGPFTLPAGQQVSVPFMHLQDIAFPYYSGSDFQMLGLPYGSGRYSMVIVLPRKGESLDTFSHNMTLSNWRSWLSQLRPTKLPVTVPKFTVRNAWNLNKALERLGLRTAIGQNSNFTGICDRCKLSIVRQKTYISVDEKGTTAAAVTSGGVGATFVGPSFIADHPFYCAIRDAKTGAVLFVGAENDPAT